MVATATRAAPRSTRRSPVVAVIVISVVALALAVWGQLGGEEPPPPPGSALPDGFPVPPNAQVSGVGDMVMIDVPGTPNDVSAYYAAALPDAGWQIVDTWEGTDPYGEPTFGFELAQGDQTGAIAFTPTEAGRVLVRVNVNQPLYRDEMRGMGG